jgi:hypothetical protein
MDFGKILTLNYGKFLENLDPKLWYFCKKLPWYDGAYPYTCIVEVPEIVE